jgi:hypothetical protein
MVLNATVEEETIAGVSGVRFLTDARPETEADFKLRAIQRELAGGVDRLPEGTTLPHLNFVSVATVDGPSYSVISLWVPKEKRSKATALLRAADFTVT